MHLRMLRDPVRIPAYSEAIRAVVRPRDIVLDLGAGVGPLSFLALEAGAGHVYAVDRSEVIEVTRQVARANGLEERITCFRCDSRYLELPERVDVILSDLRGCLPLLENNVEVLADARDRLLVPGGRLVPSTDTIFVAPVEHLEGARGIAGWREKLSGTDYSTVAPQASNRWLRSPFRSEALLAPGQPLPPLDYRRVTRPDLRHTLRFEIGRSGRCHGLGAWFESELAPGVRLSTSPGEPESLYGQAFFPLLEEYEVTSGDAVAAEIAIHARAGEPLWMWRVRLERSGRAGAEETHSSLEGEIVSPELLRRRADSHVPTLDLDGRIERLILDRIDGRTSLGDIARELAERHPERFATWEDALARVGAVSVKYAVQP